MDVIGTSDIDLINPLSWTAFATTRLTASQYSHVMLASYNKGMVWTTGASGFPDFRYGKRDLIKFLEKQDHFIIRRVPQLRDVQLWVGETSCIRMEGERYPKAEPFLMAFQNLISPGKAELAWNTHRRICSDGVTWVYNQMNYRLNGHLPVEFSMRTPYHCLSDPQQVTIAKWPFTDPPIGYEELIVV